MSKHANDENLIRPPAYPFCARDLFKDLRSRLAAAENSGPLGFERLGQLMGKSKSTAHHWFEVYEHPHLLAVMCLLERLSSEQRQKFVESHCRQIPSLEHPSLAHAPGKIGQLTDLLTQSCGLTLVVGGTEYTRTFLVTALGHFHRQMNKQGPIGIDVHPPSNFVPVESLKYIAGSNILQIRELTGKLLPKLLTSTNRLLILNGIWNAVPESRQAILRCCIRNHVILAEGGTPNLRSLQNTISTPLHLVTLSSAKRISGGILINCLRVRARKRP